MAEEYAKKLIRASQWLLLEFLRDHPGAVPNEIKPGLGKRWKDIHSKNPNFYLSWGHEIGGGEVEARSFLDTLETMCLSGFIFRDGNGWKLTPTGEQILESTEDEVTKILAG